MSIATEILKQFFAARRGVVRGPKEAASPKSSLRMAIESSREKAVAYLKGDGAFSHRERFAYPGGCSHRRGPS
jgi:hypothetical protein